MARDKERILDAYLVASARLGDREAFASLVRRWNGKLVAHAWRLLRDREGAKDAVQESWAEMRARPFPSARRGRLCGLGLPDRVPALRPAYRADAGRSAVDRGNGRGARRKTALRRRHRSDVDAVRKAIRTLPPEQQAAITLFYLEEMSVAEVAVALDVPAGTVKTRLMHARRKLRAVLEGDG